MCNVPPLTLESSTGRIVQKLTLKSARHYWSFETMRRLIPLFIALVVVSFVIFNYSRNRPSGSIPSTTSSLPATGKIEVPRASDPAVAAVVDEMLAAWDKIPSLYAKLETTMPEAAGHVGQTKGKGEYWVQKKEGNTSIRFELVNVLQIEQKDKGVLATNEVLITVIDGKNVYTFVNQPGHQHAHKKKLSYDEVLQIAGPHLFRDLITNHKLTLLPEEMRDNRATKVLKAQPNDGSWQSIHYFDKATGVRVVMTEMDAQGKTTLEIKVTEIDTNPTIDEEKFKPFVPEGVPLEDKTSTP
jgi:outer membrane lipoprotein-sorting protein